MCSKLPQKIWITFIFLFGLNLCLCSFVYGQTSVSQRGNISKEELEKISQEGSTLMMLLKHFEVLPKRNKNSYQLANEIYEMLGEKLKLQVNKNTKDMKELDLVSLMRQKRISPRDMTLLFSAFLETSEIPTAVVADEERWLLLFETDADTPYIVQWNNKTWGVVSIPVDKWTKFAYAQKQGRKQYRQLQNEMLRVIFVHPHWHWNFKDTVETLLRQGIDYGQRDEKKEARKLFLTVLKINSKNPAALNNLGNLNLYSEKIDAAIQDYNQALKIDSNDSAIYLNIGIAYYLKWKKSSEHEKEKKDLEREYKDAFEEAYRGIQSGLNLCRYLGINPKDESDAEYCWLVYDAERRVSKKEPQWRPIGGRGKKPGFPVYWKSF